MINNVLFYNGRRDLFCTAVYGRKAMESIPVMTGWFYLIFILLSFYVILFYIGAPEYFQTPLFSPISFQPKGWCREYIYGFLTLRTSKSISVLKNRKLLFTVRANTSVSHSSTFSMLLVIFFPWFSLENRQEIVFFGG